MKEAKLYLNISSPEKSLYEGEIRLITLPGTAGSFNILPNHTPIVSSLKKGTVSYITMDGNEHRLDIQSGFIEMSNGVISVCVS